MSKTKLPEITLNDWLAAESQITSRPPQPSGSVTSLQYAKMMGCSPETARRRLRALDSEGMTKKEQWRCSQNSYCSVYWLKK